MSFDDFSPNFVERLNAIPNEEEKSKNDQLINANSITSSEEEENSLDKTEQNHKISKLELENEDLKQSIRFRGELPGRIFFFIIIWMAFIAAIVLFDGLNHLPILLPWINPLILKFHLSDNVMITLLTSTTVTVVGMFVTVIKYFFNNNKK